MTVKLRGTFFHVGNSNEAGEGRGGEGRKEQNFTAEDRANPGKLLSEILGKLLGRYSDDVDSYITYNCSSRRRIIIIIIMSRRGETPPLAGGITDRFEARERRASVALPMGRVSGSIAASARRADARASVSRGVGKSNAPVEKGLNSRAILSRARNSDGRDSRSWIPLFPSSFLSFFLSSLSGDTSRSGRGRVM